jgi:CheY-like chemotaxis protein
MGSGLGLSQVYGFVQAAGGVINVYSEPGHGTRFMILFPRYFASDTANNDRDIAEMMKSSGHETVLIVDDDEQLRHQAAETLKAYGYHVLEAGQSSKALDMLTNTPVDLLIADVIMPEMGGCQLSTEVQKKYPQIKILLASGFSDDQYLSTFTGELNNNMLRKPFRPDDLLYRVRSSLDQK